MKTRVYDLGGGLVEFMAIGTAVKKMPGIATKTENLPPQAIIQDRETFIDSTEGGGLSLNSSSAQSAKRVQKGPMTVVGIIFFMIYIGLKIFLHSHS